MRRRRKAAPRPMSRLPAQHRGDRRLVADDTRGPPPDHGRASPPRGAACGAPRRTGRTGRAHGL